MKYLMPGMDEYVEGLILDRRANSFTIKRLLDGHVFNTHAGDIDIKETEQERKELKEGLSERRKEFDISEYLESDPEHPSQQPHIFEEDSCLCIDGKVSEFHAIGIAKYFKLTAEDLK